MRCCDCTEHTLLRGSGTALCRVLLSCKSKILIRICSCRKVNTFVGLYLCCYATITLIYLVASLYYLCTLHLRSTIYLKFTPYRYTNSYIIKYNRAIWEIDYFFHHFIINRRMDCARCVALRCVFIYLGISASGSYVSVCGTYLCAFGSIDPP